MQSSFQNRLLKKNSGKKLFGNSYLILKFSLACEIFLKKKNHLFCKYTHVLPRLHFRSEINESHANDENIQAHLLTYRIYRSPYAGVGTYPPHRSASRANNNNQVAEESNALRFAAAGGATLTRLHTMQQQGPQAEEAIKRQTMSARGLSDKEFTKHCRGFDVQIKVGFFNQHHAS